MAVRPSTLGTLLAGAALSVLLVGCSDIQEIGAEAEQIGAELDSASQEFDRAQTCAEALGLGDLSFDVPSPEEAAAAAQERMTELERLATETTDEDVAQGLRDMAASLESAASATAEITPEDVESWTQQQAEQLNQLREICT
ncbi:hypothetical protein [Actinoalloteichus hymeniacidonis]|uniref:Uncharacterized protein n=1 Tax=Actinoalloteichus hymeniacidonis TaxID=340345 RepID=A0AAC9HU73_9PSEU|nr:hypothetical protein [Actinoalloteichus hymeniacidonis]AOS65677.1 hypothetical protein TL08_24495 [Actinoalloteichus hymeniacidonis]MBB5906233.1 hypothetical protein [Actinoalloteichus hymeniacidonis]